MKANETVEHIKSMLKVNDKVYELDSQDTYALKHAVKLIEDYQRFLQHCELFVSGLPEKGEE